MDELAEATCAGSEGTMQRIILKMMVLVVGFSLAPIYCVGQADKDVIKITGAIKQIPVVKEIPTPPADGSTEPYKSGVLEPGGEAEDLLRTLGADTTKTTIINILRWKDAEHTTVLFQKWYLYNPAPSKTSFYLQSKEQIFQQTAIPGRKDIQFVYIHLNAVLDKGTNQGEWEAYPPLDPANLDPPHWPSAYVVNVTSIAVDSTSQTAQIVTATPGGFTKDQAICFSSAAKCAQVSSITDPSTFVIPSTGINSCAASCGTAISQYPTALKNPVSYSVTVTKQQTQFVQDLQTVLRIVGLQAGAGAGIGPGVPAPPPPGYYSVASFQSRWDTSSITIVASLNGASKGSSADTTSNQLASTTYQNEKPSWIGLSAGIPITSYKDVVFQSTSGTLVPNSITQQNAYIFLDGYLPPVLPSLVSFRYLPHPFFGVPLKGEVFRHTMLGVGIGFHWLEPFGGVIFDTQNKKTVTGTTTNTSLTYQAVFGLKISISALAKALKK
jgi:hypothetical protein